MNSHQDTTTNYLVPAAGQTHCVSFDGVFSASAEKIDWRQYSVDNFPFNPQGVFIDNSQGAGPLVILIKPINYTVSCPAGQRLQAQFPAPNGQNMEITGNGQASLFFVDFPVLPNNGEVNITGTIQANIASISPGVIMDVQKVPVPVTPIYYRITTGTSASLAAPASSDLKKLILTLSGDAILAVAGQISITVTLNGVQILKFYVYLPAAITLNTAAQMFEIDFEGLGLNAGSGSLSTAVSTALAGGSLETNAYFG